MAAGSRLSRSLREVGLRGAGGFGAALRLLPLLLAAERGQVQLVVRAACHLRAAGVRGVRVEDAVVDAQEAARAGHLDRLLVLGEERGSALLVLLRRPVVVFHRRDRLVERDVEVVVEVAPVRRVPRERPTLLRFVALDLLERRAGDVGQRGVASVQVLHLALRDLVGAGGAARAAVLPARVEHDDQAQLTLRALEDVVLGDLDHRQAATGGVQRVARAGELLLPGQQLLAGRDPLLPGDDRREAQWAHPSRRDPSALAIRRRRAFASRAAATDRTSRSWPSYDRRSNVRSATSSRSSASARSGGTSRMRGTLLTITAAWFMSPPPFAVMSLRPGRVRRIIAAGRP